MSSIFTISRRGRPGHQSSCHLLHHSSTPASGHLHAIFHDLPDVKFIPFGLRESHPRVVQSRPEDRRLGHLSKTMSSTVSKSTANVSSCLLGLQSKAELYQCLSQELVSASDRVPAAFQEYQQSSAGGNRVVLLFRVVVVAPYIQRMTWVSSIP